jgi:hypothetical protein
MGLAAAATAGMAVWIVLWALDIKAVDAFLVTVVIVLVAVTVRIVASFLPGNRDA